MAPALDKHVALVGFMGAGKTTLGEQVAERLARPFVDLDLELERQLGPIGSVFEEKGEAFFRARETLQALDVVAEAAVAWEIARAAKEKFGGDSLGDFLAAHRTYVERIDWSRR